MIIVDLIGVVCLLATKQVLKRSDFENAGGAKERPSMDSDFERQRLNDPSYLHSNLE